MQLLFAAAMSKVVTAFLQGISGFLRLKKNLRIDSYMLIYKKNMKEENISFKIS